MTQLNSADSPSSPATQTASLAAIPTSLPTRSLWASIDTRINCKELHKDSQVPLGTQTMKRTLLSRTAYVLGAVMFALLTAVSAFTLGLLLMILATSACYEFPENLDLSQHDMSKTIKLPHLFPGDGKKRYARWELVVTVGFTAVIVAGSVIRFVLEIAGAWDNSKTEGPLSIKVGMNRWLWRKYLELYGFIDVDAPPKLLKAARSEKRLVELHWSCSVVLSGDSRLRCNGCSTPGSVLTLTNSLLRSVVDRGKNAGLRLWFTIVFLVLRF